MPIETRKIFIFAVEHGTPMKVLKRSFSMTKEEVESNIAILSYHKAYVDSTQQIAAIRRNKTISTLDKTKALNTIRQNLKNEWKKINDKV